MNDILRASWQVRIKIGDWGDLSIKWSLNFLSKWRLLQNKKNAKQLPPYRFRTSPLEGQEDLKKKSPRKDREKIERVERKEEEWSLELEGFGGV